ncbi:MAG: Uncharacterised protein [Owenweeksia sp. TMED14]|nr:MAG: Uncharacterised protein [Owenweeksia sp. TMED14]|tara:strand:+ start:2116 stop:2745 length:630 start_codon:yes stop_codon:yes gene_type:complete
MSQKIIIPILSIFYFVGILGFHSSFFEIFSILTPIILLMSFVALYQSSNKSAGLKATILLIYFIGLIVEIIGVYTGFPFGDYLYLEGLGPQILNTPWMIGLNWVVLSWAAAQVIAWYFRKRNKAMIWFMSVVIMIFIDFLIEPVAPELRLWIFPRSGAGLMNFFGWVLTSGLMQFLLVSKVNPVKNDTALSIVVLQIVFFASFQIWPIN